MELELNNNIQKETWHCPEIYSLDIYKTEGGRVIETTEDTTFHVDSN
jgi:hypothetical protein